MARLPMPEQGNASVSEKGQRVALLYALVAEHLVAYYDHGHWFTEAQGASLAAEWLARHKRTLPLAERRLLSGLGDDMARRMVDSLSREAGLYTAHEMMESLDPNYLSELGAALMIECERLLNETESSAP